MRTEQTKKDMQANESVEMTVEDLTVIYELIHRGLNYYDIHYFYNSRDVLQTDLVEISTGHTKTSFELNRQQLVDVIMKYEKQFHNAVLDNVEDVIF